MASIKAMRDFLRTGGRILVTPDGELVEGGGLPRSFTHGTQEEAAECIRAARAYFAARSRSGANDRIKRIVRIVGRRTGNGWLVLEARSHHPESLH
jgi:hypothetical protein